METAPAPPSGYATIADAAAMIGAKPWDVVRLVEAQKVSSIQFVDVASLRRLQEQA